MLPVTIFFTWIFFLSCNSSGSPGESIPVRDEPTVKSVPDSFSPDLRPKIIENKSPALVPTTQIETGENTPEEILSFARTLIGTPYLFASTDPAKGFDCSGFINYVFNHFNIWVPRSSVDFTNQGKEIPIDESKPGDLILFTGTDSSIRVVGHMGIVESRRNDSLFFIHSSSGKANGVVITPFQRYYVGRFVKVIRIFPEEYFQY